MIASLRNRLHWVFCAAALVVWVAMSWPDLWALVTGSVLRGTHVSALWLVPFAIFGASLLCTILLNLRGSLHWSFLCIQVAAVVAMSIVRPSGGGFVFLVIIAWQVGMTTTPAKALSWVIVQTLALIGTLAIGHPEFGNIYFVLGLSFVLQLWFVFTAHAIRREAESARALVQANRELKSAQVIIAGAVRDAERLRISRELQDAWGDELTALGLQLELASRVTEPGQAREHVMLAKGLARSLHRKVRDVVATLPEPAGSDLQEALEALAQSVPTPAVHVRISPDVWVGPEQAHAFVRCAQEAVTNAVRHADASNLWLEVTSNGEGVRLVARDDGRSKPAPAASGMGLLGMRERVEALGGKLAVRAGGDFGFTIDAWLPLRSPRAA